MLTNFGGMRSWSLIVCLVISFTFSACNNSETGDITEVDPENIYFDYKIFGDEADPRVAVLLHFRLGGPNGNALLIKDPGNVELDGTPLRSDSSKMTGAYYEAIFPVTEFTGRHTITFTGINYKKYREEFQFQPLRLKSSLPATLLREGIEFELEGVEDRDLIRIIMTDTSFESDGINVLDTVINGKVRVHREDLELLRPGPVHLEIYREHERPLKNATAEGGKLSITYVLRREIFLAD